MKQRQLKCSQKLKTEEPTQSSHVISVKNIRGRENEKERALRAYKYGMKRWEKQFASCNVFIAEEVVGELRRLSEGCEVSPMPSLGCPRWIEDLHLTCMNKNAIMPFLSCPDGRKCPSS